MKSDWPKRMDEKVRVIKRGPYFGREGTIVGSDERGSYFVLEFDEYQHHRSEGFAPSEVEPVDGPAVFGFTHEDVRLLREEAEDEWNGAEMPTGAKLLNLADRIAALLPPEKA